MLSVINPSQIQQGGPTFPRPSNLVSHHNTNLCNRGCNNTSCNVSAGPVNRSFPERSNSSSNRSTSTLTSAASSSTSCNSFNSSTPTTGTELFYLSSSSKNSTCSSTTSSSSSSSTSCSTARSIFTSQQNSQQNNNLFSKPWNPTHQILHPGYRGFTSAEHNQNNQQSHSSTSACWLDCLSSSTASSSTGEKLSTSSSYPSLLSHRRMSTNSSSMMVAGYSNIEQCRLQQQQEHELEKTRKRLSINNSLFCNPSTSRVTNRSLPLPDGSSSKDFTKTLFVDCSIEYELPNAPKIPKNSAPILMIHPGINNKNVKNSSEDCSSTNDNDTKVLPIASTSKSAFIKEEFPNRDNNERAFKYDSDGEKKLCTSSKCSCPEAVQYRKKYQLQLQQHQQKQQQQKSFVKKENETRSRNSSSSCDNQISRRNTSTKSFQQHQECQPGCKRSYAQSMNGESKHVINVDDNDHKRASNPNITNDENNLTSAFHHLISTSNNSDRMNFYTSSDNNSGSNFNIHGLQRLQQNHLGNSSRSSGDTHTASMSKVTTSNSNVTTSTCTNDSSAAFMNQLQYISKCRSVSSDGISSNPPSSKRSRLVYNSQQQQELQQREQRRHRELQQQRVQYQQESLRKQEAAVVLAQQQQREHFLHSMRAARQHQERQAALSTLAAANLAAYRHQPSQQLTRYTSQGGASCCWPTYGVAGGQTQATTLQTNSSRHQLQQVSSFQQITPPGSMPFCWAPGPAPPTHHPSACPPTCCQSLTSTAGCRSAGCSTLFQTGRHPGSYRHQEKASYGMDLVRSKQAATMAAMACCYGGNQHSNLVPPPMACAATPALTGGNPNTVAAAAAAAAMAGAAYCLGCVQGKCQVTWNKENAVNNGIMRSL